MRKSKRPADDYTAITRLRSIGVTGMAGGTIVEKGPRCPVCGRKLAEYVPRPYRFQCPRCRTTLEAPPFPG